MDMDHNCLEVYGGIFNSLQDAEEFMKIVDGKPQRFYDELFLEGDFKGSIEIKFFDKKSNRGEELYRDFPYGEAIVEGLKARFANKLKRQVNTAIVIYDFHLGSHFTGHLLSTMKETKTEDYYIFNVAEIYPYKAKEK